MKGTMIKTFRFRLKSRNLSYLKNAKNDVNFVWNYCNEAKQVATKAIENRKYLPLS